MQQPTQLASFLEIGASSSWRVSSCTR